MNLTISLKLKGARLEVFYTNEKQEIRLFSVVANNSTGGKSVSRYSMRLSSVKNCPFSNDFLAAMRSSLYDHIIEKKGMKNIRFQYEFELPINI